MSKVTEIMPQVTKPTTFVAAALFEFKSEAISSSVIVMHFSASRELASQCLQLHHPTVLSAQWTMESTSSKAERNAFTRSARVVLPLLLSGFETSYYLQRLFPWCSTCQCSLLHFFPPLSFFPVLFQLMQLKVGPNEKLNYNARNSREEPLTDVTQLRAVWFYQSFVNFK